MRYQRPRGVNDILPEEAGQWREAEQTFRGICERYRYGEIRTPIFEDTALFVRSVGDETDIVAKEMYTFEDRSGRSLSLRAEGTAPTVRAFIENNLQGQDPERLVKLAYIGPIFRYDRPAAGRYRQHQQAGVEALGSANPAVDAEVIHLATAFYTAMGVGAISLRLNSVGCPECAPAYVAALQEAVRGRVGEMCGDCGRRLEANPLRLLDCKVPICREITEDAPKMAGALCPECHEHFEAVQGHLQALGVAFELDPRIVRGLDYYTRTAFEFVSSTLGAQDSVGGGGRYDGLVAACGGRPTPGVGLGMGLERVLLARRSVQGDPQPAPARGVLVVALGEAAWAAAVPLVAELRAAGVVADVDYRQRSLRAQLRYADAERFAWAAILGEDELASGVVTLRRLETGEQQQVSQAALLSTLGEDGRA